VAAVADTCNKSGAAIMLGVFIDRYRFFSHEYPFHEDISDVHYIGDLQSVGGGSWSMGREDLQGCTFWDRMCLSLMVYIDWWRIFTGTRGSLHRQYSTYHSTGASPQPTHCCLLYL
jgi:hypothetical protein